MYINSDYNCLPTLIIISPNGLLIIYITMGMGVPRGRRARKYYPTMTPMVLGTIGTILYFLPSLLRNLVGTRPHPPTTFPTFLTPVSSKICTRTRLNSLHHRFLYARFCFCSLSRDAIYFVVCFVCLFRER